MQGSSCRTAISPKFNALPFHPTIQNLLRRELHRHLVFLERDLKIAAGEKDTEQPP